MSSKRTHFNITMLSIILLLICFCLGGCASVNFVTYTLDNGRIREYVYLIVDEQILTDCGYNPRYVQAEITTNSYAQADELLDEFKKKIAIELHQQTLTNDEYKTLFDGVTIIEQEWKNGEYAIGFEYKNASVYKKYYELMNGSTFGNNIKKVKHLFYTKTYQYGTANYGDYTIFNKIYSYYSNTMFYTISPQETTLTYTYSVESRRIHSDADKITLDNNGNYLHSWTIDPSNPSREICFYTTSANRVVWLIACVGIGLIACAILSIIGIFKYRKNKTSIEGQPTQTDQLNNKSN